MKQLTNITAVKYTVLLLSFIFLAICFNDVLVSAEEMEPLMAIYPATELFSHMSELTQMATVTNLSGQMHTEVFHDVWQEHLKKYGSSEGLLRSAITTPAEFALVRSFFEDTTAFEKWIQPPSETEEKSEAEKTDR